MRVLAAALVLGAASMAHAEVAEPFGFKMGDPVSKYPQCVVYEERPTLFNCKTASKPHPDMDFYIVEATPQTGICFVKGVGSDISATLSGYEVKAKVDRLHDQIAKRYGVRGELINFVEPGSIWDKPENFMMALSRKEVTYAWRGEELAENVKIFWVGARAGDTNVAYPVVEFYYSNYDECSAITKDVGSDAF